MAPIVIDAGLRILVDGGAIEEHTKPLLEALVETGANCEIAAERDLPPLGAVDALITTLGRVEHLSSVFKKAPREPPLVVVAPDPTLTEIRRLLAVQALTVIDIACLRPAAQAAVVVGVAATGSVVLPAVHVSALAQRLDEPPRVLSADEIRLLELTAMQSIEAAGQQMGFSRRQIQRRFSKLCGSLGFASHLECAVAAARWGIGGDCPPEGSSSR